MILSPEHFQPSPERTLNSGGVILCKMAGQKSERQQQRQPLPPRLGESWEPGTIAQKGMDEHAQSRTFAKAGAAEQDKAIGCRQSCRKCDLRPISRLRNPMVDACLPVSSVVFPGWVARACPCSTMDSKSSMFGST